MWLRGFQNLWLYHWWVSFINDRLIFDSTRSTIWWREGVRNGHTCVSVSWNNRSPATWWCFWPYRLHGRAREWTKHNCDFAGRIVNEHRYPPWSSHHCRAVEAVWVHTMLLERQIVGFVHWRRWYSDSQNCPNVLQFLIVHWVALEDKHLSTRCWCINGSTY